ncbi:MAG: hypothetical protein ACOYJE_09510, partial [Bacteroidaceae bacterium]
VRGSFKVTSLSKAGAKVGTLPIPRKNTPQKNHPKQRKNLRNEENTYLYIEKNTTFSSQKAARDAYYNDKSPVQKQLSAPAIHPIFPT